MLPKNPSNKLETHEVFNVPSYLGDQDLWENDRALKDWTNILGGGWAATVPWLSFLTRVIV